VCWRAIKIPVRSLSTCSVTITQGSHTDCGTTHALSLLTTVIKALFWSPTLLNASAWRHHVYRRRITINGGQMRGDEDSSQNSVTTSMDALTDAISDMAIEPFACLHKGRHSLSLKFTVRRGIVTSNDYTKIAVAGTAKIYKYLFFYKTLSTTPRRDGRRGHISRWRVFRSFICLLPIVRKTVKLSRWNSENREAMILGICHIEFW